MVSVDIRISKSNKQKLSVQPEFGYNAETGDFFITLEQTIGTHNEDGKPRQIYMGVIHIMAGNPQELKDWVLEAQDALGKCWVGLEKHMLRRMQT